MIGTSPNHRRRGLGGHGRSGGEKGEKPGGQARFVGKDDDLVPLAHGEAREAFVLWEAARLEKRAARLAAVALCMSWIGCGGSDVPDPAADAQAATDVPPPGPAPVADAAPRTAPGSITRLLASLQTSPAFALTADWAIVGWNDAYAPTTEGLGCGVNGPTGLRDDAEPPSRDVENVFARRVAT